MPQIFRLAPDSQRGFGGEDPRDHDELLANQFLIAARMQLNPRTRSLTDDPYGLSTLSKNILIRTEQVGKILVLLGKELQPIAKEILAIKSPSDRENGDIVAYRLQHHVL